MRLFSIQDSTEEVGAVVTTVNSAPIDVSRAKSIAIECVADVDPSSAKDFLATDVDVSSNEITLVGHGFVDGQEVGASTDGTLPSPLSATDYFVIRVDDDTLKLATSLANALAGTAIDLTDQGSTSPVATNTLTPTALSGGSVTFQKSVDPKALEDPSNAAWSDIASASAISADGSTWYEDVDPEWRAIRAQYTVTEGRMDVTQRDYVKAHA